MKVHVLTRVIGKIVLHLFYLILIILRVTKRRESFTEILASEKPTVLGDVKVGEKGKAERLIIIDDDVGMDFDEVWKAGHLVLPWLKVTDPDGGIELIYALRDLDTRILGITIMMGVSTTEVCVQSAKNILKLLDLEEIPVLKGASTAKDLGIETDAARFIVDTVMSNPGKVEIIATGPLTNIATAIMMEPRLPENWHTLHFATGEFLGVLGEESDLLAATLVGIPDLNINVDVKAARYVLEHGGSFPIYPNEVMDNILISGADYEQIRNAGTKLGDFLASELKLLNFLYSQITPFSQGMVPHGVVPTALALDPSYKCKTIESAIELKKFGHRGYAFVLSKNPNLPKHKIHIKIEEAAKSQIHRTMMKRLL